MYINALIKDEKDYIYEKEKNNKLKELNFYEIQISETLKNFLDIKEKLTSNLFLVSSMNEKEYSLKLFLKKELYILPKNMNF